MRRVERIFMAPGFSVKDVLRVRHCDSHHRLNALRFRSLSAKGWVVWMNQTPEMSLTKKVATNCCHANRSDWMQDACWLDGWMADEWLFGSGQKIDPTRFDLDC